MKTKKHIPAKTSWERFIKYRLWGLKYTDDTCGKSKYNRPIVAQKGLRLHEHRKMLINAAEQYLKEGIVPQKYKQGDQIRRRFNHEHEYI